MKNLVQHFRSCVLLRCGVHQVSGVKSHWAKARGLPPRIWGKVGGVERLAALVMNVWALGLAVMVLVLSTWLLVWRVDGWDSVWMWLGERSVSRESKSTTIRNVGLLLAGFVAIWFALWRSRVASRQANTAHHSLLNERYQKAVDMLGSDQMSVRLGGIYALQALIKKSLAGITCNA